MPIFTKCLKVSSALFVATVVGWGSYEILRPAYDGPVGIAKGSAYAPVRDTDVSFDIWYPAHPGGKTVTVGGNGVFFGTQAGRRAPRREGTFPLVLISHGAGGNAGQFGWIASELANNGYVVVLPNHPGTTSGNASAQAAVSIFKKGRLWSSVSESRLWLKSEKCQLGPAMRSSGKSMVSRLQRMAASTGRTAACRSVGEGPVWAVRYFANGTTFDPPFAKATSLRMVLIASSNAVRSSSKRSSQTMDVPSSVTTSSDQPSPPSSL